MAMGHRQEPLCTRPLPDDTGAALGRRDDSVVRGRVRLGWIASGEAALLTRAAEPLAFLLVPLDVVVHPDHPRLAPLDPLRLAQYTLDGERPRSNHSSLKLPTGLLAARQWLPDRGAPSRGKNQYAPKRWAEADIIPPEARRSAKTASPVGKQRAHCGHLDRRLVRQLARQSHHHDPQRPDGNQASDARVTAVNLGLPLLPCQGGRAVDGPEGPAGGGQCQRVESYCPSNLRAEHGRHTFLHGDSACGSEAVAAPCIPGRAARLQGRVVSASPGP